MAVIDTVLNKVVATIPVGILPSEIETSADSKRAYVLQQQNPTMITVINVDACTVVKTLNFNISAALDFELSSDERYAYVADFDPNFLLIYDLNVGRASKFLDVGIDPFNVAATPDKKFIYVTNMTTDDITVVDTATNSVVKTIKLRK